MAGVRVTGDLSHLRIVGLANLVKSHVAHENVVIDFSSPNIAKRFHIGNLRSTLIGNFLTKMLRTTGNCTTSVNYLGDCGTQIALISTYWQRMRPSDQYWNSVPDSEKIRMYTDCYIAANRQREVDENLRDEVRQKYRLMEEAITRGDFEADCLETWRDMSTISQRHLSDFYRIFRIEFDRWMKESAEIASARSLIESLEREYGSVHGVLTLPSAHGPMVLCKRDRTTLYLIRELASLLHRDEIFNATRYLYVVDRAQRNHFLQLKELAERIGRADLSDKVEHVMYGRVKGLSTRRGTADAVDDILESGREAARECIQASPTRRLTDKSEEDRVVNELAVSSLFVSELRRSWTSDYEFSWRNTFNASHNNGLLLHSKYSRLCSLEESNPDIMQTINDAELYTEDVGAEVAARMTALPGLILSSVEKRNSHDYVNGLLALARSSGKALSVLRIRRGGRNSAKRLALFSLARKTLEEGMILMGITPIRKM